MEPKIKKIKYKGQYIYHIQFADNKRGDINFQPFLWGDAFKPLKDPDYFQKAYIDKISGTITWPNGVDFAPETLYGKITTHTQ